MKEEDTIDRKLREALHDFEAEPPDGLWERIEHSNFPAGRPSNVVEWFGVRRLSDNFQVRYIIAAAVVLLVAFLLFLYISTDEDYIIAGHAFAGDSHLCRGTAVLFVVDDVTDPRDSVRHYRSARIDAGGFYRFSNVKKGRYLIRINPDHGSEASRIFKPSWYDQDETSDGSDLIRIENKDIRADIHLIKKDIDD